MAASGSPSPTLTEMLETGEMAGSEEAVSSSLPESTVAARIDFAHLSADRLLVYGWAFGFANDVDQAWIDFAGRRIDLTTHSRRVRRPDVAEHFGMMPLDDEHGFYALIDVTGPVGEVDHLKLEITLFSGKTYQSRWPLEMHDPASDSIPQAHAATLRTLMRSLPGRDAKRLAKFLTRGSQGRNGLDIAFTLPPPIAFEIDFCGVLEERILLAYGWLVDPAAEVASVELKVAGSIFDVLANSAWIPRPDVNQDASLYIGRDSARLPGFIFVQPIASGGQDDGPSGGEALFAITARVDEPAHFVRPLCWSADESRRELLHLLNRIDVETALTLTERVAAATSDLIELQSLRRLLDLSHDRAVQRLPTSIQHCTPRSRYSLHLDHAIMVADSGLLLNGWMHVETGPPVRVECHCGDGTYVISDHWLRHERLDVSSYLASVGKQAMDHEHGFSCFVPLPRSEQPHWILVRSETGEVRRMRVPESEQGGSGLQAVRSLLGTFHSSHRRLRALMDQQIGPAVQAAWAARPRPARREVVESFGERPAKPDASIIVPLYGRWDFAEYQMALFADDEDLKLAELIYVVDDPALFDPFRRAAHDLYGIYRLPFTLVFSGTNLGFAGANNFGAEHARGRLLLLLNSDVMPKKRGWLGELVRAYDALEGPGVLGVKLLYEEGSLQHAGIAFRRHQPWGGLWINDHPGKGQNPSGLHGTIEVPAVTAACALIEASLYRQLNGFSEDYIVGDFEDSDLCLRALAAGRSNYVALDIELYHLERQSQNQIGDSAWRTNLTQYNCWLHNQRWAALMELEPSSS